eukprot:11862505-Ditylum_brightwellii.AAC.1
MGYYHIRLDPDVQRICTIVFPWGKYQYLCLPMGIKCAPDVFQEQMYEIMIGLNCIKIYLNSLLMMTSDTLDNYLHKLILVLDQLQANRLKVNPDKSTFCTTEIKYLGYWITQDGIQLLPKKIQYYGDIWQQRSHILAPLTDLVGKGKKRFKWERINQESFKTMKKVVSKDALLAYPNINLPFEIHMNASDRQLGAILAQNE